MDNPYEILGVGQNSTKDEIKKAYRRLAHKHHPDKGGNEDQFKKINEAYYILSDEKRKREYDRYGRVFSGAGGGTGDQQWEDVWSHFRQRGSAPGWDGDLGDIFGDIFGFASGERRQKRGRDIPIDIEISFKESIFGTTRGVLLRRPSKCLECLGSGAKKGSGHEQCKTCGGSGKIRETRRSVFGAFTNVAECRECLSGGQVPKEKCKTCRGEGILQKDGEVEIKIPAGISEGEMIRVVGEGETIKNGVSGDLYVKIHVPPHPEFKKEGIDLIHNLEIPLTDALLGSEKTIKALDGNIRVKIPRGIDSGEMLRIRERGVPARQKRGDLIIKVSVLNPKKLSRKAEDLIKSLKKEGY